MLRDRLKTLLNGPPPLDGQRRGAGPSNAVPSEPVSRQSNGLDQFFHALRDQWGLSLLDLAGASQSNIEFITGLGHRIYSEDFTKLLDDCFSGGDFFANQADPERLDRFCQSSLGFEPEQFDAALIWDSLEFVAQPLLQMTVDRLAEIMRPGAHMLAFFHADEKATAVPAYSYRITDQKTISLTPRGRRARAQYFNNRAIEKLFSGFGSLKFFLTRDSLREVLVKR